MIVQPDTPAGVFPSTHWSLLGQAKAEDAAAGRLATGELLRRYLPALRAHLRRRKGVASHEVEDVLQGFVLSKVLEGELFAHADRLIGKFRTLLLTALDRYLISQRRYESAAKRDARATIVWEDVRDGPQAPPAADQDAFDMEWARQVLQQVLHRMREECLRGPQAVLWGLFEGRVLRPALQGLEPLSYEQLIEQYHFRSPSQATNALVTAKRAFRRHLRDVISEYARDSAEVEVEIADLQRILGHCA
jgi:hypothetical protein